MCSIGKQSGDGGFTVLELLVVMTLLATASIAVTVWVPDIGDRMAVDRATNLLQRELARVAFEAGRTGYDQTVILQRNGPSLNLRTGDRTTALDPTLTAKWIAARETETNESQGAITFWGLGGASGGTFELSRGRSHAAIDIDWLTAKSGRKSEPL